MKSLLGLLAALATRTKGSAGRTGTDSLMLVLLAKIKSIVYGNLGSSALARVLVAVND